MAPLQAKGKQLLGVLWFETGLALATIALRWYTRQYIRGYVGWDDRFLIITWVFMAGFAALCTVSVSYGMGVHAQELTVDEIIIGVKYLLIGQLAISISMGTSKVAVALFLMRIVQKVWQKAVLWFWIITIMALSVFLGISVFAQCQPVESIWNPRVPRRRCTLDLTIIAKIMCSWSAAMDFFLALFPWLVLWRLNMKPKEKITICVSLSLGVLAGICGVIRTAGLDALSQTSDYLYATSDSVMWTMSELTLTIICVCIPTLRPLYKRMRGENESGESRELERSGGNAAMKAWYGSESLLQKTVATVNDTDIEGGLKSTFSANTNVQATEAAENRNGIHRKREVSVSYENRKGNN